MIEGGAIDNLWVLSVSSSEFSNNSPYQIVGGFIDLGGNTFH